MAVAVLGAAIALGGVVVGLTSAGVVPALAFGALLAPFGAGCPGG